MGGGVGDLDGVAFPRLAEPPPWADPGHLTRPMDPPEALHPPARSSLSRRPHHAGSRSGQRVQRRRIYEDPERAPRGLALGRPPGGRRSAEHQLPAEAHLGSHPEIREEAEARADEPPRLGHTRPLPPLPRRAPPDRFRGLHLGGEPRHEPHLRPADRLRFVVATHAMPTSDPGNAQISGTLLAPGETGFVVTQLDVDTTAAAGFSTTINFKYAEIS